MGRLRKTDAQRRAEQFRARYEFGKHLMGFTDEQISKAAGICRNTLISYKKNPEKCFGTFRTIGAMLGWQDEDYLAILKGGK